MYNAETVMKAINSVPKKEKSRYCMRLSEMSALYKMSEGDMFIAMGLAFDFGFAKGKRCEKTNQKRKEATV